MSAIQKSIMRLLISKNREVNKFARQIKIQNIAQLLPSKKPSTNARAQTSNLQEQLTIAVIVIVGYLENFVAKFFSCWSLLVHISLEEFLCFKVFDFKPAQLMSFGIK